MEGKWEEILSEWGMEHVAVEQRYRTVWEINGKYMLKGYEDRKSLERNVRLLETLSECGAPVARIVKSRGQEAWVENGGRFWLMTAKLPGGNLTDIRKPELAFRMGETIGRLHVILKKCEERLTLRDNSLLDEMEGWIRRTLEADGWRLIGRAEYEAVTDRLKSVYEKLPKQLIHRDVHFGNFLFQDGEFSGYIDFDLSQRNIRIFDIGYFLAGLLTRESGLRPDREEWLGMVRGVLSGYESVVRLEPEEKDALACVMESIELLFAAYFIGEKDRSSAADAADIFHRIREWEEGLRGCFS